ncbi:PLP-dependent aminotransferase family protein [soil metagenome]
MLKTTSPGSRPSATAPPVRPSQANWGDLIEWRANEQGDVTLYDQVAELLRREILAGSLPLGSRLPSTRQLMAKLGVSRTTVITAYAQLTADGYVTCKVGSGTYVTLDAIDRIEKAAAALTHVGTRPVVKSAGLSKRGERYADMDLEQLVLENVPFNTGVVRIDGRASAQWHQIARHQLAVEPMHQGYDSPQGGIAIREEICRYLSVSRKVRCTPDQIIMVAGAQQAIDLTIKTLLDPGASVWLEEPGYPLARLALANAGMNLHSVPVDRDGIRVSDGIEACPDARAAFVTPSHQYPLGVALSIARRLELLQWAADRGAWIVEDDYDSEFRYDGPSLPALQGLDTNDRVIYIGTFSKVLLPTVRYGYMVVPPALVKAFSAARFLTDRHSPIFFEKVLTEFINRGYFVSHIRRMRVEYCDARDVLVAMLNDRLGHRLDVVKPGQGLHLIAYLREKLVDTEIAEAARLAGVIVKPLSRLYSTSNGNRSGLMFGFAGFEPSRMKTAVDRLSLVFDGFSKDSQAN